MTLEETIHFSEIFGSCPRVRALWFILPWTFMDMFRMHSKRLRKEECNQSATKSRYHLPKQFVKDCGKCQIPNTEPPRRPWKVTSCQWFDSDIIWGGGRGEMWQSSIWHSNAMQSKQAVVNHTRNHLGDRRLCKIASHFLPFLPSFLPFVFGRHAVNRRR